MCLLITLLLIMFFFVSDLKIVYYNNYSVSQYTWDPFDC